jgi:bifunctional ADP-heptose synthase (sugar kinase/adenylyltransferase)
MLTDERIEQILTRLPQRTIGVLGDLFLDRYLDIDAALTEKSIETELDAYQVTRVRPIPGCVGTIMNNLVALGVGKVVPISIIGDDGEGYELRQALARMPTVDPRFITTTPERRTPTYTKPMLQTQGEPARELNRLDIKNRTRMPGPLQDLIIESLHAAWPTVDALIVLDQVSEEDCGVVTARVREELAILGESQPNKFVLADSRERIELFRGVCLKPNVAECEQALNRFGIETTQVHESDDGGSVVRPKFDPKESVSLFAQRVNQTVFCTWGSGGIWMAPLVGLSQKVGRVRGYPVTGPIDIVGAGDSTSAGITSAVAAGASLEEAAAFGCLVASITVQQIGTTGSASPEQVRQRWREVRGGS